MTPLMNTELGTERRCNSCGEFWPLDGEFYHRNPKGIGGFLGTCRACFAERRGRRDQTRRVSAMSTIWLLRQLGMDA